MLYYRLKESGGVKIAEANSAATSTTAVEETAVPVAPGDGIASV